MELLSVKEASELCKQSRQTIWLSILLGRLKAIKVGRNYIIQRSDLEEYKRSRNIV
jgi:excisionase family DNA binding protein